MHLPDKYTKCSENLEKDANPTDALYHYTNWTGLKGILDKQQLWLTLYSQLNDTSEIHYALKFIRTYIFSIIAKDAIQLFWNDLFEAIQDFIANEYEFFVGSFCMKKNHLYSWRAYADDGAGFSIGFKREFFSGVSQLDSTQANAPNFGRCKVYYNFDELEVYIYDLVEAVHEDLKNARHNPDSDAANRVVMCRFMAALMPFLIALKDAAYSEEHEHRIYTSKLKSILLQTFYSYGGDINNPHLNSRKHVYFQFDLNNISEIWIGPKLNFEHAKYDIEQLLQSLKKEGKDIGDINIIPSKIPYKNR